MTLRLRIVSDHRRQLGEASSIELGARGGSIGRGPDNDWVLPDPMRYVSARHAVVRFHDGSYLLEDVSSNGTFVNDEDQPLSRRGPHRLRNGDLLRLGDYHVSVAIDVDSGESSIPANVAPLALRVAPADPDLDASLDLKALLPSDTAAGEAFFPPNAFAQSVVLPVETGQAAVDRTDNHTAPSRLRDGTKTARPRASRRGRPVPISDSAEIGLQAFCRGAGIESGDFSADAHTRLLTLAGQLFREALVGMKDLDRAQGALRAAHGVESEPDADDPRPALARTPVDELLVQLFSQHESRRLDAVQWLREQLEASKRHELAVERALDAAFTSFVGQLEPTELEARFERTPRRGPAPDRWTLYREFFRNLAERPDGKLPHFFLEAFAAAYRDAIGAPRA